jgi:ubiquinone/menaquinone biosynthesis C-methylase UbiE
MLMDPTAYEQYLVPVLFDPLAEALLAAARPVQGRRVLDVACGTGVVARRVATTAAVVTGVDVNPAMLALAARLLPRVQWVHGDAVSLPLTDRSYDAAFCEQGLQFTSEPAQAVRELRRVLTPGGQTALAVWCDASRAPGFDALATVLDRHGGPGHLMRAPFRLGDATTVRALLESAGFTDVRCTTCIVAARFPSVREFFLRQIAASPLAQPLAAMTTATHNAMIDDLSVSLADRIDDDGLLFPAESHIFVATA